MRDKYANKTPVMRFFHKYTGFIIAGVSFAIIVPWIAYDESQKEFFENWSCGQINAYSNAENTVDVPQHDELTDSQHERLHVILDECNVPNSHDST